MLATLCPSHHTLLKGASMLVSLSFAWLGNDLRRDLECHQWKISEHRTTPLSSSFPCHPGIATININFEHHTNFCLISDKIWRLVRVATVNKVSSADLQH